MRIEITLEFDPSDEDCPGDLNLTHEQIAKEISSLNYRLQVIARRVSIVRKD